MPGFGHKSHIEKMHYFFKKLLLYFGGWFKQTQKDIFDDVPIDSYCINRLYCTFSFLLLIIIDSMMGQLIGMLICALLTRRQCRVSDTQVTVNVHRFLVFLIGRLYTVSLASLFLC